MTAVRTVPDVQIVLIRVFMDTKLIMGKGWSIFRSFTVRWSSIMDKQFLRELSLRMEQRREEITSTYNRLRDESKTGEQGNGALDYVDYALNSYTKEFLLSLSNMERKELHQIEEALVRMRNGTYGQCQECGEKISKKRLNAVPWARHCIECQELEEQGLLPSTQFRTSY